MITLNCKPNCNHIKNIGKKGSTVLPRYKGITV